MTNFNAIDKNIIITGGTGAVSHALAKEFLQNGAQTIGIFDVIVSDQMKMITSLQNEFKNSIIVFYQIDVRQRNNIRNAFSRFISQFGNVDLVINANYHMLNDHSSTAHVVIENDLVCNF